MTPTAKRQQIVQSVISGLFGHCYAVAVNVVNVQIVFVAAVLAGIAVAFQRSLTVAAKKGVIPVLFTHSLVVILIRSKPLVNALHVEFALAFRASVLNARSKHKIIAAFGTLLNRAFQRTTSSKHLCLPRDFGLRFLEVFRAAKASFLGRACWCVGSSANNTLPVNEPASRLSVGLQSARLTAPHVGGSFVNDRAAVWASQCSVFSHCSFRIKNERILAQVR